MDEEYSLLSKHFSFGDVPEEENRVLLVHPRIRRGRYFAVDMVRVRLQLDEAVTLVNTLPKFNVVQ